MKVLKAFWNILLVSIFTSCITSRYIDIQVLNPGSVKLPSNITLHVVEPQETDSDYRILLKDSTLNKNYFCKLLTHNFDSTLKAHLEESPMFSNSRIIIQNNSELQSNLEKISPEKKREHVSMFFEKIDLIESKVFVDYDLWNYEYNAAYSFYYKFRIELRNMGSDRIYDTYTFSDTLTWNSSNFYKDMLINELPSTSQATIEIGKIAGERYADKMAPFWTSEERMLFYSGNRFMRQGYNQFLANDLDGSIQTWKHLYEVGTPLLASVAAHNIALVYEMQDDFSNSELWLNNSLKARYHFQTEEYLDRIKERKAGRKKLDEEMIQP
ncbi:MAG TPA: DUF6340 family protein [Bacteroidales bacterium]